MAHNVGVTGKGRPRIGATVQVRLPDELLADIDRDANTGGRKRAEQIRLILTTHYSKDSP
jgi:metal-responsive CopG/Arc/MetJ family transcriptional regulator